MRIFRLAPFLLAILVLTPGVGLAECDTSGLPEGTDVVDLQLTGGTICLEMLTADAPIHVENFLYYVQNAQYNGGVFHRFLPGFVLQGGNNRRDGEGGFEVVPPRNDDDVMNEPCTDSNDCDTRGNTRGNVALAKAPGLPNSGSTNWFINLVDNSFLDTNNGGFTVFARVMGDGMDYVDSLTSLTAGPLLNHITNQFSNGEVALTEVPSIEDYPGCFDPFDDAVTAVIDPAVVFPIADLVPKKDPRFAAFNLFFLPLACGGTLVENPESFVANACSGDFSTEDELAIRTQGFTGLTVDPAEFYSFTCEEVDVALPASDEFSTFFTPRYEDNFVYIESATHFVVPEPSAYLLTFAATLTLLAVRRRSMGASARRPER